MNELRIGVVGYSGQKFDEEAAKGLLAKAILEITSKHEGRSFAIVSGLTDVGIPALAYRLATVLGYRTVGIACSKAEKYECYDVDEKHIVGDEWGDESQTFLGNIDCIIRVGGGNQSLREVEEAKGRGLRAVEFELEALT